MRGRIVKTDNAQRLKYVNCEGEFSFGERVFNMLIENGEAKGKLFSTSQVEEIIIKTKNSIYKVKVIL